MQDNLDSSQWFCGTLITTSFRCRHAALGKHQIIFNDNYNTALQCNR